MNKKFLNRIISFVLGTLGFAAALWLKRSKWTRWVAVPLIIVLVAVSSFFYYNGVRETPYAFAVPDMIIASSPNIVAGAASSTTAQLTAPSPKTTSSFFAGRISDDTNPLPSLTITPDYYTELEWNLQATSTSANGDIFNFRVTNNGTVLDTYTYTPVWIIGSNSPPATTSSTPIQLDFY